MQQLLATLFFTGFSAILMAQTDSIPPSIVCQSNVSVDVYSNCRFDLWATDPLDTGTDLESNTLQWGIRKKCTGAGFPEHQTLVTFSAVEYGPNLVEIWARDTAGNASH